MLTNWIKTTLEPKHINLNELIEANKKAEILFEIIKETFDNYMEQGQGELRIYFPEYDDSTTFYYYDIRIENYCGKLNNTYVNKKLKAIFKSKGIKYKIYPAYYRFDTYMEVSNCTGLLVTLRWKKNHLGKSYIIM